MLRRVLLLLWVMLYLTTSLCFAGIPGSPQVDTPVKFMHVRWANHIDAVTGISSLRLVFDISGPVEAEWKVTNTPVPQLVVNVKGAVPGATAGLISLKGKSKLANKVRISTPDGQNSQITIALPVMIKDGDYKVFTMPANASIKKPFRVVVDISKPVAIPVFKFTPGLKGKVICIDPGHGGTDVGAVGPNGDYEKTVTLAIALKLRYLLEQAGAKVYMTRTTDRDVYSPNDSAVDELSARVAVGNKNRVNAFIDIHANSFPGPDAVGTETYFYEKTGYDKLLADCIQNSVVSTGSLADRGTDSANFYVLKFTTMPAILIETAFISNPNEEKLLTKPEFQQKVAQGIVNGLDNFFNQAAKYQAAKYQAAKLGSGN